MDRERACPWGARQTELAPGQTSRGVESGMAGRARNKEAQRRRPILKKVVISALVSGFQHARS